VKLRKAEKRFKLTTRDYAQLAAFRHALRAFLRFSETAAAQAGLATQHYQAMLVLRGWPEDGRASIGDLAQQLLIKHNSAVGLVDRLVQEKLVVREPSRADRRKVELRLTGRGRQVLAKLAAMHRAELERLGPFLTRFFNDLPQLGTAPTGKTAPQGTPELFPRGAPLGEMGMAARHTKPPLQRRLMRAQRALRREAAAVATKVAGHRTNRGGR
jgi:DNA-binding MarR family transcriptional regulator